MKSCPNDLRAILTRIEKLERQNLRLKVVAATGLLFLTVGVLAAFQTTGQQQRKVTSPSVPDPINTTVSGYGPIAERCVTASVGEYENACIVKAMLALPNTEVKLNFLARAVDDLWLQRVFDRDWDDYVSGHINQLVRDVNNHADLINQIGALAANDDSQIRAMQMQNEPDAKRELDDFKDAVCPLMRAINAGALRGISTTPGTAAKIDSACGLR